MNNSNSKSHRKFLFLFLISSAYSLHVSFAYITGIYFIHLQYALGATASQASLAVAIPSSFWFLGGPIYGVIYNAVGYKKSFIISTVLSCTGLILTNFIDSIGYVYLLWGVLFGFGGGLCSLSCFSIVGQTFGKTRSFAISIPSTFGMLVSVFLGPITQYLINQYGWRGSVLLYGAMVLHAIPLTLLADAVYTPSKFTKAFVNFILNTVVLPHPQETPWILTADTGTTVVPMQYCKTLLPIQEQQVTNECQKNNSSESDKASIHSTSRPNKLSKIVTGIKFDFFLLLDPLFLCYIVGSACCAMSISVSSYYLVRYSQDIGFDDYTAIWFITIERIAFMIMCPIMGIVTSYCQGAEKFEDVSQKHIEVKKCVEQIDGKTVELNQKCVLPIRRSFFLCFILCALAFTIVLPTLMETSTGFLLYAVTNGIASGWIGTLPIAVLADFYGGKIFTSAFALRSFFAGVWFLFFPYVTGILIDMAGNYRPAQYVNCGLAILAAILICITQICFDRRNKARANRDRVVFRATSDNL